MSVRDRLVSALGSPRRFLWGAAATVCVDDLIRGTSLAGRLAELTGRSVLIVTRDQLTAALAIIELDGVASRIIICTPDLLSKYLPSLVADAGVDAIVSDDDRFDHEELGVSLHVLCSPVIQPVAELPDNERITEWVLLTSGTTGAPKMVSHTFASLAGPIDNTRNQGTDIVWGTFYDIRRYGGLQILLRAVLGRGSFVLSDAGESTADFLQRLAARGATHVTGTPSHWRRALMSPHARAITPRYVRLSGEIADQAILNALHAFFPDAGVGHAFASTEAGVAFEVNDGLEGFPVSALSARDDVEIKIEGGSIRIRSSRTAACYLTADKRTIADETGFVDTGDMVEQRGDRYYFLGRKSGVVNIGGQKVYPEEIEAVINRHSAVRMSVVRARNSRITGSLVAADVVLKDVENRNDASEAIAAIRSEILQSCRESLAAHKVPATIRFVPTLEVAAAGKLARRDA